MDETLNDSLDLQDTLTREVSGPSNYYGTLEGADRYFSELLYGQLWAITDQSRKLKALIQSTKMIENLAFLGSPNDETQSLSFPRNGADTPVVIEEATYEVAFALLRGKDVDTEQRLLYTKTQKFGKIQTDFDYSRGAPEHIVAGIPSTIAWAKLRPYLSANLSLNIRRES